MLFLLAIMKVRYRDIAQACGVSAMTVSRALRMDSAVAQTTRQRILAAAQKVGYFPTATMGRPRREKGRAAAAMAVNVVIGTGLKTEFYSQLLICIEQELAQRGCDCIVRTCGGDYARFLSLCETLRHAKTVGTLIMGYLPCGPLATLLQLLPGAVLVDHPGDPRLTCLYNCVMFDNTAAARMAVGHLIEIGRRRVLLVKGFEDHYFSQQMEQGYREALQNHGVNVAPELIRQGDFTAQGAEKVIRDALAAGIVFDAVFTNDEMACGVVRVLQEQQLAIPRNVAVAGCDGLPVSRLMIPRLTTVILDCREMAREAVARMLAPRDLETPFFHIKLLPKLEIRESTVVANSN